MAHSKFIKVARWKMLQESSPNFPLEDPLTLDGRSRGCNFGALSDETMPCEYGREPPYLLWVGRALLRWQYADAIANS